MVIDPNVWVSAVINPFGVPARVVEAVTTGKLVAVVSQHLLDELTAVLIRPKFRRWVSVADAVAFVETLGGYADLYPDHDAPAPRVRDPNDASLVALAEAAEASSSPGTPTYWTPTSRPRRSLPVMCSSESREEHVLLVPRATGGVVMACSGTLPVSAAPVVGRPISGGALWRRFSSAEITPDVPPTSKTSPPNVTV